jgi:hypothetical protein
MIKFILILGLLGIQAGCGYLVLRGDTLLGYSEISIANIEEPSVIGITTLLTRHLEERLLENGLTIVSNDGSSPLILEISLKNPRTSTTIISSIDRGVPTYRESLTLQASLKETASGQIRWQTRLTQRDLFRQETNEAGDTALLTEAGRQRSLDRIARRFALELSNRMLVASLAKDEAQ